MPEETVLAGAAGTPLADLLLDDSAGVRWVVVRAVHAPAAVVAPALLASYGGHRAVTDDDALAALLVGAGGVVRRRAHDYEYDLGDVPPSWAEAAPPAGFELGQPPDPEALAEAHAAANAPGHPDHDPTMDHAAQLRSLLSGIVIGPNVPGATWQVSGAEGPCGAVIVSERPARADLGSLTWVLDLFVHPRHQGRGLGGVLLRRAVAGAAAAGYRRMGLVVTDGNPARAVYDALGFRHLHSGSSVDLPGER